MKDWLNVFLPLWVVGSIAWMIGGFVMLPTAFRQPVLYSANGVWTTRGYDPVNIDWDVARALAIVIGPPVVAIVIALMVTIYEKIKEPARPKP